MVIKCDVLYTNFNYHTHRLRTIFMATQTQKERQVRHFISHGNRFLTP